MYRPALVIGLGGTGVLTLRHLKARMLASPEGKVPPQVKLIAIDTVSEQQQAVQLEKESKLAALRTELEPGEYFWVGGDVYEFAREVAEGKHPHVGSWFQARTYLDSLPRASFILERGAGQLRQFGRLAVFHDVAAPARSSIKNLIDRAIAEIRTTGYKASIDVFLVASVAGGTGAGMFVDMAYLVRKIAETEQTMGVRLRGFLVLSEAFSAIPGGVKPSMRARAFACMRENRRFMVDFQYEHGYPMYYHEEGGDAIWRSEIRTKLFDFLYHVDGQSQRNPLTHVLPEYGVPAAIADVIAAMLEKPAEGGEDVYDRHIQNVITQAAQIRGKEFSERNVSFDSAVGIYSLIMPMHRIVDYLTHRLVLESMEHFLAPERKDEDGFPMRLSFDQNAENPGVRGRNAVPSFFEAAQVQSLEKIERTVEGTPFLRELSRIVLNFKPEDPFIVQELAARDAKAWEMHLDPPGTSTDVMAMRERVRRELDSRLEDEVPASQKNESDFSALERIKNGVESYKGFHLGREDVRSGRRVGGKYRAALDEYARFQLDRFRAMLAIQSENILNGGINPDDPPSVHRGGKLGYYLDFLGGIEEFLGRFMEAMRMLAEARDAQGEKQGAQSAANTARHELEAKPKGLFAGRRRKAYIDAEQRWINVEKTLIIEEMVRNLVDQMLKYTRQLRENAERWAATLAIGHDSLYGRFLRGMKQVKEAVEAEKALPMREIIWDEAYLEQLYSKYTKELRPGVDDYLSRLFWRYEERITGVKEEFGLRLYVEPERMGLENQERNFALLQRPAKEVFQGAWQQESILKYLMSKGYPDPNHLARRLAEKGDILLLAGGKEVVPANYLHVAYGADPLEEQYLNQVQKQLENLTQAKGKLSDKVKSDDRFVLSLVHTLDLIPLEEIESYKRAEPDYWSQADEVADTRGLRRRLGRETLHIFPAEVNAARFESRMASELQIKPYALHNDIVLQLENMARFRLFVRSWAFDIIHRDRQETPQGYENFWCVDLPEEDTGSVRGPELPLKIYLTIPTTGEPDIVQAMMNWHYRRRDVRPDFYVNIDEGVLARIERTIKRARDTVVARRIQEGLNLPEHVRHQLEALASTYQEEFRKLWAEREYLRAKQSDLKRAVETEKGLGRDTAVVFYLALADDVQSLEIRMDDILKLSR